MMLFLLIALVTLPRISVDFYLPSLPAIGLSLNTSQALLQMTLTIFMLGYAVSMLVTGPLSDHYGEKRLLVFGLTLYSLATLTCAVSTSINVLIIARFFQALGGCCGTVIARVMVKKAYAQHDQVNRLATLSAAMAICPLIIPVLGAVLQTYWGWRVIFYGLAGFALLILWVSHHALPSPSKQPPITFDRLRANYKILLTNRLFWRYSLTMGLIWSNYFAFTLESPFLLQKKLGLSPIFFSLSLAVSVFGYLCGTQITKHIAYRMDLDRLIGLAIGLSLVGTMLLIGGTAYFSFQWMTFIPPMILIMAAVGIIIPCTQTAVMQPFSQMPATASGLFFCIQMLLGVATGLLLQSFPHQSVWPLISAEGVGSLLLAVLFYCL